MGDVITALINALNEYGEATKDINTIIFQKGNYKVRIWITSFNIARDFIFLTVGLSEVSYKYHGDLSKLSYSYSNTLARVKDGKIVGTGGIFELAKDIDRHIYYAEKELNGNY